MSAFEQWIKIIGALAIGFLLLTRGADWLVHGSVQIARKRGVSTLVVGLTIVAFGTSAPEIVVSALAATEGKVDLSLGNVLGSNIANIGLVMGACAVVLPRVLEARLNGREIAWLFLSLGLLWFVALDRQITRVEGALLLGAFVSYNAQVLFRGQADMPGVEGEIGHYKRPAIWVALGIVAVAGGAKFVVMGAELGALRLGIPESVIGLTVVAVGTSLPELAAGLGGALRGEGDISIGNVVGSNIFNLLAVIGLVAVIHPFEAAHGDGANAEAVDRAFAQALSEDLYVVLAFSLAAVLLPRIGGSGRTKGAALLVAYVAYSIWLYASRG